MKIISTAAGLFGPFERCEVLDDRIRAWAPGAADDAPGSDLPLAVIGDYQVLDQEPPAGFCADIYIWNGAELELAPAAPVEPEEP